MTNRHTINVFISHSWSYCEDYDKIHEWLCREFWNTNGTPVYFNDYSVPKDDPIHYARNADELRNAIFQRIALSHVVVIPTGMYASYSNWIQKEIDGSRLYSKPIVAVDCWGAERTSSVVASAAAEVVGWQKQSVAEAVWRQADANAA
jgi:hypothetical protein